MAVKAPSTTDNNTIAHDTEVSPCWSTYWKRLQVGVKGGRRDAALCIIDDNAKSHETRRFLSSPGSLQERDNQWDRNKDSVVGFCNIKKNRWGTSPTSSGTASLPVPLPVEQSSTSTICTGNTTTTTSSNYRIPVFHNDNNNPNITTPATYNDHQLFSLPDHEPTPIPLRHQDLFLTQPSRRESLDQRDLELLLPQRRASDTSLQLVGHRTSTGSSTMGTLESLLEDYSSFDDDDERLSDMMEDMDTTSSPLHISQSQQQRVIGGISHEKNGQGIMIPNNVIPMEKGISIPVRRNSTSPSSERSSFASISSMGSLPRSNLECIPEICNVVDNMDSLTITVETMNVLHSYDDENDDHDNDKEKEDNDDDNHNSNEKQDDNEIERNAATSPFTVLHLGHETSQQTLQIPIRRESLLYPQSPKMDDVSSSKKTIIDRTKYTSGSKPIKECTSDLDITVLPSRSVDPPPPSSLASSSRVRRPPTRTDSRELAQDRRYERRHAILAEIVSCVHSTSNGLPPLIDIGSHTNQSITTLDYIRAHQEISLSSSSSEAVHHPHQSTIEEEKEGDIDGDNNDDVDNDQLE